MEDNNYFTINSEIFQRMCDMGDAELKKFLHCEKWWRAAFTKAEATGSRLLVNRFERLHDEWNDETQTQFAAKLGKCKSWDEVEEKAAAAEKKANEADFDRTGDVLNEESRRYKEYIKNRTKGLAAPTSMPLSALSCAPLTSNKKASTMQGGAPLEINTLVPAFSPVNHNAAMLPVMDGDDDDVEDDVEDGSGSEDASEAMSLDFVSNQQKLTEPRIKKIEMLTQRSPYPLWDQANRHMAPSKVKYNRNSWSKKGWNPPFRQASADEGSEDPNTWMQRALQKFSMPKKDDVKELMPEMAKNSLLLSKMSNNMTMWEPGGLKQSVFARIAMTILTILPKQSGIFGMDQIPKENGGGPFPLASHLGFNTHPKLFSSDPNQAKERHEATLIGVLQGSKMYEMVIAQIMQFFVTGLFPIVMVRNNGGRVCGISDVKASFAQVRACLRKGCACAR